MDMTHIQLNTEDINEILHSDKDSCGLYIHSLIRRNPDITWNFLADIFDQREDKFTRAELKEHKMLFELCKETACRK